MNEHHLSAAWDDASACSTAALTFSDGCIQMARCEPGL
jgi:hypothetical protein